MCVNVLYICMYMVLANEVVLMLRTCMCVCVCVCVCVLRVAVHVCVHLCE